MPRHKDISLLQLSKIAKGVASLLAITHIITKEKASTQTKALDQWFDHFYNNILNLKTEFCIPQNMVDD
jgi:hypothetical protein